MAALFCFSLFSQEESVDDFDDLFSEASDLDEAVITEQEKSKNEITLNVGSLKIPLSLTGNFNAEVGAAYIWNDGNNDGSAYFDLQNKINFITRPDRYLALRGSLKTSMPDTSETEVDGQNHYFYLYELYFDYIMLNSIYITAGKKEIIWGNVRLFSSNDDFEDDDDALFTNALYDSRDNISGTVRIPIGPFSFTTVCMFKDSIEDPSWQELSFAANMEIVFYNTCVNFFARTFPERSGKNVAQWKNPIIGAEVKRTIFGFDFYAQELAKIADDEKFRNIVKPSFYERKSFKNFVTTAGVYRIFMDRTPYFGFDFEFQNIYYPNDTYRRRFYKDPYKSELSDYYGEWTWADESNRPVFMDSDGNVVRVSDSGDKETLTDISGDSITSPTQVAQLLHSSGDFVNRFALNLGLSKLGRDRNLKIGIQWNHNITLKSGFVKPGIIFSRIFPHCDWNVGLKYEYGDEFNKKHNIGKITLGTFLKIKLDY